MEFLVDFQGFQGYNGKFIFKELSVISLSGSFLWHTFIKSPPSHSTAPVHQVDYCTRHIHGIKWEQDGISFSQARRLLFKYLHGAQKVYIKGAERTVILQKLLKFPCENIEVTGCPKIPDCFYSIPIKCNLQHKKCSLYNVQVYKNWYNGVSNSINW